MDQKLPLLPPENPTAADHALNDPLSRIALHAGDITQLPASLHVDAIVNAANESLQGGGDSGTGFQPVNEQQINSAIHRAAGPELLEYNRENFPTGCPTGLAKHTPAFDLQAQGIQHILHAVGPVWQNNFDTGVPGAPGDDTAKLGYTYEDNLLASCYTQVFALAVKHNIKHLAIPAISTGVYRFPKPRAAKIAFGHAHGHLLRTNIPQQITFICFTQEDAKHYEKAIQTRGQWMVSRGRV